MPELFTKVVRAKMKQTGVSGLDEYVSGNYPKEIPDIQSNITIVQTSANGSGLCKKEHDFYILKLSGTQYEMGYQHGYLVANHIDSSGAKDESEKWFAGHTLIDCWGRYLEKTLPRMVHPREMVNELIKRISDDNFRGLYGFWKGYLAKTGQKENEQTRTIRDFIITG